jgi:hypothetical protein
VSFWDTLQDEDFQNSPLGKTLRFQLENPEYQGLGQNVTVPTPISLEDFIRQSPRGRAWGYDLSLDKGPAPWDSTPKEIDYNQMFPMEPEPMPTDTIKYYEGRIPLKDRLQLFITKMKNRKNK